MKKENSGDSLFIGIEIFQYKILEKLGSGGMGEVYLAEDTKLNRRVALKFLPVHLSSDKALNARFINEARAAARLNHPNIVTIFEVNEYESRPFFVMEYVEGKSLTEIIGVDGLPYDQVIDITLQICEGSKEAHHAGITHRDIKPSNIIIDKKGRCRILDFGLAAVQSEDRLTKTGSLLGTVEYMSPEQVRGEKVDHRSDIFSLGVLLYEMLTGKLPFKGDYMAGVVYSIINEIPEMLDRHRPDISGEFQKIVDGALEKDLEIRYQQIDDLMTDLKKCQSGQVLETPLKHYPSIAVLPFRDMSQQKDQEYLCDGVAEDIINALTHLEGLRVVARTSAFSYRGRDIDIREIGRKLNVQSLLEGSIQKTGDRLRITAQLINVSDGYHIWSEKYDRRLEDVFAIQDEISLNIVDRLKVRLLGEERAKLVKRGTSNQEAYMLYLKGRYFWNRRYEGGLQKAIEHFQQAIGKDPGFALAYSGLADGFAMLGTYSFLPPKKAFTMAKNAALKALEIDDSLPEAVTSLAYVNMFYDWDWEAAECGYKRAIELDPYYASAHEWYGMLLAITGRYDESIVEMSKARDLDPLGLIINAMLGWTYQCLEQYDDAIEQYQKTIEMDPNFTLAYFFCAVAYIRKSMYEEAIIASRKFVDLTGGSQSAMGVLGFSYASSGDSVKAHEILDRLKGLSVKMHVSPFYTGLIHGELNENDTAFEHLEKACEDREPFLVLIRCWHLIENLRSDERYYQLLKKIGLDK
ncbi:MAG: protein kinase [Candidatus Zixiibacteriota bacterium]|nr:MAG: protein kinase [candidate division Zixibacteria bacterium]